VKLLRNPVVVSILAVLALALVVRNVFWPMLGHVRWYKAPPAAMTQTLPATAPVKPGPMAAIKKEFLAKVLGQTQAVQVASMDLPSVTSSAPRWARPRRDPFNARFESTSRAAQLLKLKGIWRQSGRDLAVINKTLVAEGDTILEFEVEKIEGDHVWVVGPGGREALSFGLPTPMPNPKAKMALESEPTQ
jgi:hypothetical protein